MKLQNLNYCPFMKFYKLFTFVLSLCIVLGCTEKETQVEVSSVSLNTSTIEMVEGETFSLVATVLPKDAEYDGVIWASSNASVANVNSGAVSAVKEGTATITASAGGKSATCSVKVSSKIVAVTSITLDKTSLSMQVGETETITAIVSPDNATDKTVEWGSSDVAVATVVDGIITAKKSGEATITAKSGSCIAECKVTITVSAESVTLDKTSLSLAIGESATLTATVKPDDATDKTVAWSSSDESVAKVDNGKVTAVKSGKATVTAKCGVKTAECAVTVTVPVSSITLDKTTLSLVIGESFTLTATVKPDDATDKTVTWSSSDESVAKVDNGKVTAVKSGKATVTAKCGVKTAECAVTVTVPVSSITLDKTTLSLVIGESFTLTATVKPDDATDKTVAWSSSDESVARVDNGKVTAVNAGQAKISAAVGNITTSCNVVVYQSDNVIIYTTADKKVLKPYNEDAFGSAIVSNTYVGDVGIITFEKPVTFIGNMAFNEQSKLKSIVIPNAVSTIGKRAFFKCTRLLSVKLPPSLTSIDDYAFYVCSSITTLVFPDNVQKIGGYAFSNCYNAFENNTLVLPKKLQTISMFAFEYCKMHNIIWPEDLKTVDRAAFYSCDLEEVTIPGNILDLGPSCFMRNPLLTKVTLLEGITNIKDGTFVDCTKLRTIYLPSTINSINDNSLTGCYSLKDVYIKVVSPFDLSPNTFKDCDRNLLSIWVPRASVEAYKEKWSAYKDNIKAYDF